jgi:glucose-1-phosphate adenylyltransferase
LLFSNVWVDSHSLIEDSVILPGVRVGHGAVLKRVVVDRRCEIPDGMVVGVDVAEDRRRFDITDRGITLITPEMLGQRIYYVR